MGLIGICDLIVTYCWQRKDQKIDLLLQVIVVVIGVKSIKLEIVILRNYWSFKVVSDDFLRFLILYFVIAIATSSSLVVTMLIVQNSHISLKQYQHFSVSYSHFKAYC
jgi:hypothetical protein